MTAAFGFLTLGHFIQALGSASVLMLPLYLGFLGASRAEIGTIMAVASVSSLCVRPLVGWALDTWGRKPMLLLGTLLASAAMVVLFFARDLGVTIYVARILSGIGGGLLSSSYITYVADIIPAQRRTEGLAIFGISGLVPLAINPFASQLGIQPADLQWFLPMMGLLILSSLWPIWLLREPTLLETRQPLRWLDVWHTISARVLWPVWFATMLFAGLVSSFVAFVTVSAASRGIANAPYVWLSYAIGALAVRLFGRRLPDRIGPEKFVVPAALLYALSLLVIADATNLQHLLIAGLLAGLGQGYCFPIMTSQVISRTPERHRGSAMSMYAAIWSITDIIATPLLGKFADHYSDSAMFALMAIITAVWLLAWLILEHKYRPLY
jgi:MFS family permease